MHPIPVADSTFKLILILSVSSSYHVPSVRAIENTPTLSGDLPVSECTITAAGELAPGEEDGTDVFKDIKTTGDKYEDYPDDEDKVDINNLEVVITAAKEIREGGNALFKAGKYDEALQQYKSECLICLIIYIFELLKDELELTTPS